MSAALCPPHVDRLDGAAQLGARSVGQGLAGANRGDQPPHALAIGGRDVRVQGDRPGRFELGELPTGEIPPPSLLRRRAAQIREVGAAVGSRRDEAGYGGLGLGEASLERALRLAALPQLSIALEVIFADEQRHGFGRKQLRLEAGQYPALQLAEANAFLVGAGAGVAGTATGHAIVVAHRDSAAAEAAADQAREKVARPPAIGERPRGAILAGVLDPLPQSIVDDAEVGQLDHFMVGRGIDPRDAVAALRIPLHRDAVVDEAADIDRSGKEPELPGTVAEDGRHAPLAPSSRLHALGVQIGDDRLRAAAVGIFGEDADDDCRLVRINPAPAGVQFAVGPDLADDVIAVAKPAGDAASGKAAALAAPDLVAELCQLERIHGALKSDLQLVDGAVG